jgi:thiol-disulfide isomerase/thioredoxin
VAVSPAPPLVGAGLSGEHLDISTYRGQPVVIFFWATWCDPCRAEQPELNALAARYPGVHFIGDDVNDEAVSARTYVADLKVPFPSVFDKSGVNPGAFLVPAIPTTIVVNGTGKIVGRYVGTVSGISQKLDALLSAGA